MEEMFLFFFSCSFENSPQAGYLSQELSCLKLPVRMYQPVTSPLRTSASSLLLGGVWGRAGRTGIPTWVSAGSDTSQGLVLCGVRVCIRLCPGDVSPQLLISRDGL